MAADGKRQERTVSGAIRRMLMRQLSMGFEKWQSTAAAMKAEADAIRRALMRMVHGKLSAATSTWRVAAADSKRQQRAASGAIRRMLMRQLSMGFRRMVQEPWKRWALLLCVARRRSTVLKELRRL